MPVVADTLGTRLPGLPSAISAVQLGLAVSLDMGRGKFWLGRNPRPFICPMPACPFTVNIEDDGHRVRAAQ